MKTETLLNAYAKVVFNLPGNYNRNDKRHRQAVAFRDRIIRMLESELSTSQEEIDDLERRIANTAWDLGREP